MSAEPVNLKDKALWEKQILINNTDDYSRAVTHAARAVMISLDAGDDFTTAHDKMYNHGLTGFQAGCVANIVFKCHQRGTEFRDAWNHSWGVESEDGVVNPAILSVSEKQTPQ